LDDVSRVLDTCSSDSISLIGHSWGATLALLYAALHPTRIDKLLLLGIGPVNAAMHEQYELNVRARLSASDHGAFIALRKQRRQAAATEDRPPQLRLHNELIRKFYSKLWVYTPELREGFADDYIAHSNFDPRVPLYLLPSVAELD
jgi:pimeloyl-ACP methyl ester carboxylesterase